MNKHTTVQIKRAFFAFFTALILILSVGLPAVTAKAAASGEDDGSASGGGYAVSGQLENSGYLAKLYDASNGLPTSDANFVLCARDGYIYIGGYSGILRYDGRTFERLDASDGLTNGRVLFEDERGRILVGTNDNGVVVLDGETRTHYTFEDGLPSSSIRAFAEEPDGRIVIGSTAGISYIDREGSLFHLEDERINSRVIQRLSSDKNGTVYGSTNAGDVFSLEEGRVSAFYSSDALGSEVISTIFADPSEEGLVYIGTEAGNVYCGKFGEKLSELTQISDTPSECIYFIARECGRIWVTSVTRAGYIDESNCYHALMNLPMNNSIDMMTSDYQGNLWMASSRQGIMKVVTSNFRDVTKDAGLAVSSANTTCICQETLYIGTDEGLAALDAQGRPLENELTRLLEGTRVRCITGDAAGNLWLSTFTNDMGLICFSPDQTITQFTTENGLPDNRVRCTVNAEDGAVLAGTNGGLAIMKDGAVKETAGASEVITNTIFLTICEGDDGDIYAGTDGDGIYVINGSKERKIGRKDGLTSDVVMRIKRDREADVFWIITSNSLEYMKDGRIVNVDTFPYNNNFDVFWDSSDNLWVIASIGVYCVSRQEALDNNISDYRLYSMTNGLAGAPTSNSYSALDENGDLYISERGGVCCVNIDHFFEQEEEVKTGIQSVCFNESLISPDPEGAYTIPAQNGRLQITPAVLDYTMTDPLVNVYLEGTGDPGITDTQSRLSTLEYTNLKAGDYTLHIRILNKTTQEVLQDAVYRFVKQPVWTELLIVRLFTGLLLSFAAGFIVWRVMRMTVVSRQLGEIKAARDEAERANTAKSRFLANMSHELRTPIITIMGMNEMVLREEADGVPKAYFTSVIDHSLDIRNAAESLLGLINNVLDMSRIESGKLQLVEQDYDAQDMLRSVISMIRARSADRGLFFDVTVDELLPRRLYGDMGKIKQIVLNLLSNAVKYTEKGGFSLSVSVEEKNGDTVSLRFMVKDTGSGIKQEDIEKLFVAYERLDEAKNSSIQGTGLGLDISRKFAELMGGRLWCESVYGEGSEFILTLSQRITDHTPVGVFTERDEAKAWGTYVPRFVAPDADILVVDDNPINLDIMKGLLKPTRVFVTTSLSGSDALDKIRDSHFNVVFLDHMMPGMDGVETVEKIRETDRELPVYALTANTTAGEEFYLSKGFNGCLTKPVDIGLLEETLMRHIPEDMMEKPIKADEEV